MRPGGRITIDRRLLDPAYLLAGKYAGPEYKYAWIDLIGLAAWEPYNDLRRGELRASIRFLAARWGWGVRRVITFLRTLEDAGMVEHLPEPHGKHLPARIVICNYDSYQYGGDVEETQPQHLVETRMETRMETRTTTKRRSKKEEEKRTSTSLPAVRQTEIEVVRPSEVEPYVNGAPASNVAVPAILGFWVEQQGARPTNAEIAKQGAAVRRLVQRHGAYETAEAFMGMPYLYAYRDGVYDAFDVEKQFSKARLAFRQNETLQATAEDWGWLFNR